MTGESSLDPTDELRQKPSECWPHFEPDEIDAVSKVLRSGKVNQWTGPEVFAFEKACARTFGGEHCIAVANGTLALELALRTFGIGPGDEVVVTPRSFVASAACVRLLGATPVFADVDLESGNITPGTIAAALTNRTRAIIPVHLAGWPCDMPALMRLAQNAGVQVIEDCAQAHGAAIDGKPVGSFGDAAAFSFCQDKIISTGGEGGATLFREECHRDWAWSFKDHGKDRSRSLSEAGQIGFRWLHDAVGTNWRLTGMQAAIGLKQLSKLPFWHSLRTRNAHIWADALTPIPGLRLPLPAGKIRHAFYKLYFYLACPQPVEARDEILGRSQDAGLRVFSGSCSEIYLEGAFDDLPRPDLPVARALGECSLSVEVHPTLDPNILRARSYALAEIVRSVLRG